MDENNPIVTFTINPSLDINAAVDTLEPVKKMRCSNVMIDPGGGGINVSRTIARLGGNSTAVFLAGGSTGKSIETMLDEEGVKSAAVALDQDVYLIKPNQRELEYVCGCSLDREEDQEKVCRNSHSDDRSHPAMPQTRHPKAV